MPSPTCSNLLAWEKDAAIRRARCREEKRRLSIGIVGQMKAGKSTFLNHLLFGGQPLLPKAATPKTAALTRIRYGDTPRFIDRPGPGGRPPRRRRARAGGGRAPPLRPGGS